MDSRKPVNMIDVLCDPRRVQRIALTCRCGRRWVEYIPQELHDSDMTAQFECIACHTLYHLYHHQLRRVKEDALHDESDRLNEVARSTVTDTTKYDA